MLVKMPSDHVRMQGLRVNPFGDRLKNILANYTCRREWSVPPKDPVAKLQSMGMDISDTSMSRLEGQTRLVQDFEIPILARALEASVEWLLQQDE